jgi:predicted transcriptional regulator
MDQSQSSKPHSKKGRINIHQPDYKGAKLGYTRVPTSIAEDPLKWGLTKVGLHVYLFLLARVKKEVWFNGERLKKWMGLGKEAVSNGLQNLVEAGFCKRQVHRDASGRISGWEYAFYAIPTDAKLVASIDKDIADLLRRIDWFDKEPNQAFPEPVKPDSGNPPFKGKEERIPKRSERRKTPNPLRGEEGRGHLSGEKNGKRALEESTPGSTSQRSRTTQSFDQTVGLGSDAGTAFASQDQKDHDPTSESERSSDFIQTPVSQLDSETSCTPPPGQNDSQHHNQRWRERMMEHPVGRRFLDILRPEQIPDDPALRSICTKIRKGAVTAEILAYLEDNVIRPNHTAADRSGRPLKAIPEIMSYLEKEGFRLDGITFRNWKNREVERLNDVWHRVNVLHGDWAVYHRELNYQKALSHPVSLVEYDPGPNDPPLSPPIRIYVALVVHGEGKGPDPSSTIVEELRKPASWQFLIKEATLNHAEFQCLAKLVERFNDHLPSLCQEDLADLWANWQARRDALKREIEVGFNRIGSKPPLLNHNEEDIMTA